MKEKYEEVQEKFWNWFMKDPIKRLAIFIFIIAIIVTITKHVRITLV